MANPKGIIRAVKSCGVVWNTEEVKPLIDWVTMNARYEAAVKAGQELAARNEAAARKRKIELRKGPS